MKTIRPVAMLVVFGLLCLSLFVCCGNAVSGTSSDNKTTATSTPTTGTGTTTTSATTTIDTYDLRDAVAYHIVIDRFNNGDLSNDSPALGIDQRVNIQGGDISGILSKINDGYFTTLGVNLLCISCPFSNTTASHTLSKGNLGSAYLGEWPIAFDAIDPRFGTEAELKSLVDAAHAKGMHVVLGVTPRNVESSSTVYSTHSDWFWPSFGILGTSVPWGDAYSYKAGLAAYLPPFDFENASSLEYSISSLTTWFSSIGLDGYKVQDAAYTESNWLTSFRSRLSSAIDPVRGKHSIMVVDANSSTALEVFLDPSSKADAGIDQGLAYAANFDILARTSPMSDLDSYLSSNSGAYNGIPCLALFTGSTRPINYAEDVPDTSGDGWSSSASPTQSAFERMETAFAIVFTLPGMPYIEYGDEIGMTGHGEPLSYQMMHFALSANEAALHDRVALLASIRAAHSALRNGSYSSLGSAADTLAFKVSNSSESVIVLVNRSDAIASLGGIPSGSYTDAITGTPVSVFPVSVLPRSAMILVSQ